MQFHKKKKEEEEAEIIMQCDPPLMRQKVSTFLVLQFCPFENLNELNYLCFEVVKFIMVSFF